MNPLDYLVLFGTMLGIAAYGIWRTRGRRGLSAYLKGSGTAGWVTIGLSVMATQASAITFLSVPGQGYEDGLGFVQNYFGMPLALILVAAVFLPMFRRWNVYTAYEFLGRRFDTKTRLLGAGLFLLQRGLGAGITIYAPAIVLSTVFGWPLELTIILSGLLVIIYTVTGGNDAVSVTQKYQILVIFGGMVTALAVLLARLSGHLALTDALHLAGTFHKLNAVDFSPDLRRRYTFWSGLFGGLCLSLSYFGTDQSQVQRYISGASLRESRLGLMFNAVCKIPMQFLILLLGVLMFVFYQFEPPPVFFNQSSWKAAAARDGGKFRAVEQKFAAACEQQEQSIRAWLDARRLHDSAAETAARARALAAQQRSEAVRAEARAALRGGRRPRANQRRRLRVHHLHPGGIAAWGDWFAGGGVFCGGIVLESGGTERARLDDLGGFLPAPAQARRGRDALREGVAMVHGDVGRGGAGLRAVCAFAGKPHPGGQHCRVGFLRSGAGTVPGGVFCAMGARDGGFFRRRAGAGAGLLPLFHPEHQLSLVQFNWLRRLCPLQRPHPGIGLATKKRTQKLCNSITSCFVFQSQAANDSQANCEGVGGCKTPL